MLTQSYADLWGALARLQREKEIGKLSNGDIISGIAAYNALREVYFDDPGDPSRAEDWRRRIAALDRENALRAKKNKPPRVALVFPRRFLERHDAAIEWLAKDLKGVDLHAISARPYSEDEEAEMEHNNASIFAVFQRLRVAGAKVHDAKAQTAKKFDVDVSYVERVIEFRSHDKPDTCIWGGCDRAPWRQDLCIAHYNQKRRSEKKERRSEKAS